MFRLLRLKPPHGWNAVAWELTIVTLGVLVALAAQQTMEALHDRSIAAETRADVTDELNSNLMSMVLRQSSDPCIERRLTELRAIVTQWEKTGSFETPRWVAQTQVSMLRRPFRWPGDMGSSPMRRDFVKWQRRSGPGVSSRHRSARLSIRPQTKLTKWS